MKIDNSGLEDAIQAFMQDKTNENFVKIMEQLEKAFVYLPIMMPDNLDKETMEALKTGSGAKVPKDTKIVPCLLKKESGEQALPIFSSQLQIPEKQKSPAVVALPFFTCVSMAMANTEKVQAVVLNPFTQNIILPKQILEVADKRSKMMQTKTVKLTQPQFHQFAHRRLAYELLPVFLYEKQKEGLEKLQKEGAALLISLLSSIYPKEIKVPDTGDDFSLMTLNVTENLQITRIDMPEKNVETGSCLRIYAVWIQDTESVDYYTIEKEEQGNAIGRVYADRKHELLKEAPDNGAEIETIMNLAEKHSD